MQRNLRSLSCWILSTSSTRPTEYVADARARIQASTKAVLEITDPPKYAVTGTARKALEGRKLFVINTDTDMPAMTSARADRF